MSSDNRNLTAQELMTGFARRTGLLDGGTPTRYLWTDAFAVCNWLQLGERDLALRLVDQVHHVLGRHRGDDSRGGWLSGLADGDGEAHPTSGGLRIGKSEPERAGGEPLDERREWERDGQYFHYLTRWMHALDRAAHSLEQPLFNVWARELAAVAHRAFVYDAGATTRAPRMQMFWKMSIDLSRPLVDSMGHHDPLDGYVTYVELEATADHFASTDGPRLDRQCSELAAMIPQRLATADPLGLGGLLVDAHRIAQLARHARPPAGLLERVLEAALDGLRVFAEGPDLRLPADHRLAFRELGLAIGLAAISPMRTITGNRPLDELQRHLPLRDRIESFWLDPASRHTATWADHENINDVMLATSLLPAGYLNLGTHP